MNKLLNLDDTIVAPATGSPPAAIAIVRLSGKKSFEILEKIFRPRSNRPVAELPSHRMVLGMVHRLSGEPIDEVLGVLMRAPRSFTGEDVAELHTHGSAAVVRAVVEACVEAGARVAEPGEFTRRAFLNGRMDLVQAEALADLIHAQTQQARRLALRQLQGGLSSKVMKLREWLLDVAAELEAWIDFPEEEIPIPTIARHLEIFADVTRELQRLTQGLRAGLLLSEGARVVIAGRPNAGKSSLFNMLVGRERAIVTPHPGTTRDTIESTVELGGIAVTLVDTAGLRHTADEIEGIGIERARQEIRLADLVLLVVDASHPTNIRGDLELVEHDYETKIVVVLNKTDLASEEQIGELTAQLQGLTYPCVQVSCNTREGLEALVHTIQLQLMGSISPEEVYLTRERHAECLRAAEAALQRATHALKQSLSPEFVMVDVNEALAQLGELLGVGTSEEILDRIFSRFCLGK
ncbi:MAG: tRNA uridine-5-carboxymethylaminomethyl(34) synthesis GTPase MnmE [Candidatus Hydrogenedentota bacterium]|uniref:tRNA modification GTPase MnmE n=1 Tax=Sumerlaea chitinivorans TaxID=2250252 RepID=A0A2Z4Y4D5_SUMC1|nr:GTPase and tRNA-U34 5-formylation enzyme TrmE [Candidatus Sumerlaea chitinivorans]RMH26051.1 MAG: tRNA uridine-5-carboxymethylaminomethyl(34) synthesis GTPase MnmE [Candidatus Hydrogenedentota bacterium]GIX44208.1 MAG: tRNA modification GTPase MnmE [Candidatus Sumerlaea sp.]